MRRAARKWKNALPVVCFLCLAFTLAMAVYTYRYEPDRYAACYTFFALPPGAEADENALTASRMLARDAGALLRAPAFRESVTQTVASDGFTSVTAVGVDGTHMIQVRAVGVNPAIVTGLANGAGRELVARAASVLQATGVVEITPAALPQSPCGPNRPVKVAWALVGSFLCLSLAGALLGSSRQPVCWIRGRMPPMSVPCVAAVADCGGKTRSQPSQTRKGSAGEALLNRVDRLTRESVREVALAVRAMGEKPGRVVAFTGMESDEHSAAVALLTASELASQGFDTLLMEMDVSGPKLGSLLGVSGENDVLDCLRNEAALRRAILPTSIPRLCFVDLRHDADAVAAVAATDAFRSFLSDAAHSFDYVIVNAPSAAFPGCAGMLGAVADVTLLIVPDGGYTAGEIEDTASALARVVKRLGGFILSRVPRRRFDAAEIRGQAARNG